MRKQGLIHCNSTVGPGAGIQYSVCGWSLRSPRVKAVSVVVALIKLWLGAFWLVHFSGQILVAVLHVFARSRPDCAVGDKLRPNMATVVECIVVVYLFNCFSMDR